MVITILLFFILLFIIILIDMRLNLITTFFPFLYVLNSFREMHCNSFVLDAHFLDTLCDLFLDLLLNSWNPFENELA